ncbi:MAG: serine/threonine-protein phosphatase [Lachnospiraceae bacterium]|nr:serine/threonine-protein phosphatase [Lachnospiraceae bacterium]
MRYIAAYHTDVGLTKKTNQDSLGIKVIETKYGQAAFGIVCDGMGGLAKGELASKEVILAFLNWFDRVFIEDVKDDNFSESRLNAQWDDIIQNQNKRLGEYGKEHHFQLGTTVSAILMLQDKYYTVHVGDSRIYQLTGNNVYQLTNDQTFIAREIAAGRMTPEQAKTDPRRSVLLQCVGASDIVRPDFASGIIMPDTIYMICSDGFRHQITEEEMLQKIGPLNAVDENKMRQGCVFLTELVKKRQESDNITVGLLKTVQ